MKHFYFLFLISGFTFISFAQEEDESCLPPSKKVLKLIDTGSKAPDAKTAAENFNAAVTEAPDNAMVYYEYGLYAYNAGLRNYDEQPNPAMGDRRFQTAEDMFRDAKEFCSD